MNAFIRRNASKRRDRLHPRLQPLRFHVLSAAMLFLTLAAFVPVHAATPAAPDEIIMRDGDIHRGLIIRQTNVDVTLRTPEGREKNLAKADIRRIRNIGDGNSVYATVPPPGHLPPWRVIANDLRNEDRITSFEQIPATVIDEGVFRHVPYRSFRANDVLELNVYGDPDDPAGIEVGVYGARRNQQRARDRGRQFLASYLTSVDEINALYDLDLNANDIRQAGPLIFESTLPDAPDAYGAWWISIYNKEKLDRHRMSASEYAAITTPAERVVRGDGTVEQGVWEDGEIRKTRRIGDRSEDRVFVRGFHRDDQGRFQLLTIDESGN